MKTRLLVLLTCLLSFLAVAQLAAADTIESEDGRRPDFERHWRHGFHSPGDLFDPIIDIEKPGNSCGMGGTHNQCLNGQPFSLASILSGNTALETAQLNGTGSWRVVNDTGATITDLVLYFDGSLASHASLTIGMSGWNTMLNPFSNCQITTATAVVSSGNCGVSSANNPARPDQLVWSVGTRSGIAPGQIFNIQISWFHGKDAGCISGTDNCMPLDETETPEPGTLALLGTGMLGIGALLRRKLFRSPGFTGGAAVCES